MQKNAKIRRIGSYNFVANKPQIFLFHKSHVTNVFADWDNTWVSSNKLKKDGFFLFLVIRLIV